MNWAPSEVMLEYFEQLDGMPDKLDARYLLSLLMIRRRVVRLEETKADAQGTEVLVLYCPRRESTYEVVVAPPDEARAQQIQDELAALLVGGET